MTCLGYNGSKKKKCNRVVKIVKKIYIYIIRINSEVKSKLVNSQFRDLKT